MTPIKMVDGQFAYPITNAGQWASHRRSGTRTQFTSKANNAKFTDADNRGGWVDGTPFDSSIACLFDSGKFLFRAVVTAPARPTFWQRIKGWFA